MKLLLPYPPSANRYWRFNRGQIHVSEEAEAYKRNVRLRALAAGLRPLAGLVTVTVIAYRPQRSGDLDNTLKVTLDALKRVAFKDDNQVVELIARRRDDPARPRLEIEVSECA